jgi:hypothetical protein
VLLVYFEYLDAIPISENAYHAMRYIYVKLKEDKSKYIFKKSVSVKSTS